MLVSTLSIFHALQSPDPIQGIGYKKCQKQIDLKSYFPKGSQLPFKIGLKSILFPTSSASVIKPPTHKIDVGLYGDMG
ncbi:predicted protein [Botrytis cinerea T4]|uniref:Uncharacterized protein n=1 Tax=Botryotinia fuckeliana (strain T4) TaxID=999810 RepID=G2YXP0_BOTF4|nr:predicted protein [Botrytis cinerea T4]